MKAGFGRAPLSSLPTLRNAQRAVFEEHARRQSVLRIAAFLRRELPEPVAALEAANLERLCAQGAATARSYGLEGERDQAAFVGLQFVVAPDFHRQPAIRRILEDPSRAPEDRIAAALILASPEDWEEAGSHLRQDSAGPTTEAAR